MLGDLHINVAIRPVVVKKYPALRRHRPADFHNPVRGQLFRGNLQVVRTSSTSEKGPCRSESRRQFVVIQDTLARDIVSERMQHGRQQLIIALCLDPVHAAGRKQYREEIE